MTNRPNNKGVLFLAALIIENEFWKNNWILLVLAVKLAIGGGILSLSNFGVSPTDISKISELSSKSSDFCSYWLSPYFLLIIWLKGVIYFKFVKLPNSL